MFTKTAQTVNSKTTNGKLKQKVGLITADEIVAAGSGKYGTANYNYYLYKSSNFWYWSLSPYYFYYGNAYVFRVYSNGYLNYYGVYSTDGAVAPVINLKAEYVKQLVKTSETGNPYRLPGVQ